MHFKVVFSSFSGHPRRHLPTGSNIQGRLQNYTPYSCIKYLLAGTGCPV